MKTALTCLGLALTALNAHARQDAAPPIPPAPVASVAPAAPAVSPVAAVQVGFAEQVLAAERLVKAAPYCAQAVHETVQTLADGNRIVHQQTSQLCRDGEGRTRQEVERQGRRTVYLRDPVSGENWQLDPERKTARYLGGALNAQAQREHAERMREHGERMREYGERMREYSLKVREWARENADRMRDSWRSGDAASAPPMPKAPSGPQPPRPPRPPAAPQAVVIAPGTGGDVRIIQIEAPTGPLAPLAPIPVAVSIRMEPLSIKEGRTRSEPLPAREIDGLKVTGARSTSTIEAGKIGNEKPIVITHDVWTSPELQLTISSQIRDPRSGEQNYQLRQIRRAEPDAALMRVPPDFQKTGEPAAKKREG